MSSKRILVVDDDKMIRDTLKEALSEAGYTVKMTENAEEAMDVLRQENIMVMFLDLKLPGMSGIELCRQIRKENPIGIIYALTAHFDLFSVLEWREAGFDDFFSKPFLIDTIQEAAQEAFKKIGRWNIGVYD